MSKYTKDFKLEVVRHYLSGFESLATTANRFEIDHATVAKWVSRFNHHGISSLDKRYSHYSPEFKLEVLRHMRLKAWSLKQAIAYFNIPEAGTLRKWQKLYTEGGVQALHSRPRGRPKVTPAMAKPFVPSDKPANELTPKQLQRELEYLRAENAYLKKLRALVQEQKQAQAQERKPSQS
jgi:transposase-like protein